MDKLLHVLVGITLAANPLLPPEAAAMSALAAATAKEWYDVRHLQQHTKDAGDWWATAAGAVVVLKIRWEF